MTLPPATLLFDGSKQSRAPPWSWRGQDKRSKKGWLNARRPEHQMILLRRDLRPLAGKARDDRLKRRCQDRSASVPRAAGGVPFQERHIWKSNRQTAKGTRPGHHEIWRATENWI